jgi:pseudaminic acid biosynthesis-associated methylase
MADRPTSVFEIGANIGLNLDAIRLLIPDVRLGAVEVNAKASHELRHKGIETTESSIEEWVPVKQEWDLVLSKGVLIHLNPESLKSTYSKIARSAKKWVLICEYFSRTPTELEYRGQKEALYKRDFAGEFLNDNENFVFHSAGFASRLSNFPQDDLTWFLLRNVRG